MQRFCSLTQYEPDCSRFIHKNKRYMQGSHYIFKIYIPFIFQIYVCIFVGNISYMCELQPIFIIMLNTLLISSVMWHIYSILFVERFNFITCRSAPFYSGSIQCLHRGMIFNDRPLEIQGGRGRKRLGRAYMATHCKVVCFMQHFTHLLS